MTRETTAAFVAVVMLGTGVWAGPAAAADPSQVDQLALWPRVSAEELDAERGGADVPVHEEDGNVLVSLNIIDATASNTAVSTGGGSVTGIAGVIDISSALNVMSGNKLSMTAINTANDVVMSNTAAVNIYLH